MQPYSDATPFGTDSGLGKATKRSGAIVARSPAAWDIIAHPLLMDTCAGVLGEQLLFHDDQTEEERQMGFARGYEKAAVHPWDIDMTQLIEIFPDSPAQPLHQDGAIFIHDGAFRNGPLEPMISTIWALNEFTADVGPTRALPGSHRWDRGHPRPKPSEAAHAVMPKGSVVIYTGSCWHSGGENRSTRGEVRRGLNVDYSLAWLRQEENQYLECPPAIAKHLPRKMQDLIGYRTFGSSGFVDGTLSPKSTFKDERPFNWANEWQKKKEGDDGAAGGDARTPREKELEEEVRALRAELAALKSKL